MSFGVDGVRVGHWTDVVAETGCTVVDLPPGTVASAETRGGAPASRELGPLEPGRTVSAVDAVLLTGGSVFGLAAADGVVQALAAAGRGVPTAAGPVPIVPTLALFDLAVGDGSVRPTAASGRAAVDDLDDHAPLTGRVGAGAGAYVAHWRGPQGRRPGGLGHAVRRSGRLVVAALCAVNAFGDVTPDVSSDLLAALAALPGASDGRTHTTIGVVVTNARLDKTACHVVAQGAHDGLARAVTPPHTRFDGDTLIACATGGVDAHLDLVRLLALDAVAGAVRTAG